MRDHVPALLAGAQAVLACLTLAVAALAAGAADRAALVLALCGLTPVLAWTAATHASWRRGRPSAPAAVLGDGVLLVCVGVAAGLALVKRVDDGLAAALAFACAALCLLAGIALLLQHARLAAAHAEPAWEPDASPA